jgi:hypothetical protein
MLTDISGNGYTVLSNNFVGAVYTPPQLFNREFTIWYDFSDKTTMFSDTGATSSITNNQMVRYVRNKAPNRPLYDLINPTFPASTSNSSYFGENSVNTNKHSLYVLTPNTATAGANLRSISAYSSSGKTAFTLGVCFRFTSTVGTRSNAINFGGAGGLAGARLSVFTNTTTVSDIIGGNAQSFNYEIYVGAVLLRSGVVVGFNNYTSSRYLSSIFVLENNRDYYWYVNDSLVLSGAGRNTALSAVTTIFTSSIPQTQVYPMWSFGGTQNAGSFSGTELLEVVFSDGEALSYDRVIKLFNYYQSKYNFRYRNPNQPLTVRQI